MEQWILNYWKGYVQIQITGDSYDRFLNLCAYHGIKLWKLMADGDVYTAYLMRQDFKKLKNIVKKSHAKVCIRQKHGFPFFLHKYRKRKAYAIGVVAALMILFWMTCHIWNISIDGNFLQTDDVMFEYLEQAGIRHGMLKARLDCKALASDIRNYFSDFSWTAAEIKGTHLIIHVKEGILDTREEESEQKILDEAAATDLAAEKNGTVISIYVRSGRAVVGIGDEVEKGEVLVSGFLPIKNDDGEIAGWQQVQADADIVIKRTIDYKDEVLLKQVQKEYTGRQQVHYLVRLGKVPFALPNHFGAYETYELLSELTQFRLMENFYLPIYVQKFTAKEFERTEVSYTKEQAEKVLNENFQYFIKNLEEKGVQIFENDVKIEWNEKSAIASGTIEIGESAYRRKTAMETAKEELLE